MDFMPFCVRPWGRRRPCSSQVPIMLMTKTLRWPAEQDDLACPAGAAVALRSGHGYKILTRPYLALEGDMASADRAE